MRSLRDRVTVKAESQGNMSLGKLRHLSHAAAEPGRRPETMMLKPGNLPAMKVQVSPGTPDHAELIVPQGLSQDLVLVPLSVKNGAFFSPDIHYL